MTKKKDEFTKEESTKEVTESSISTNSVTLWIQQFEKKSSTTKKKHYVEPENLSNLAKNFTNYQ